MAVVEVVAEGRLLVFVRQVGVGAVRPDGHGQQPVHHDVRVSAGGGGGGGGGGQRMRLTPDEYLWGVIGYVTSRVS